MFPRLLLTLLLWATVCAVGAEDLPLVNPGFEAVSAAGPVVGWSPVHRAPRSAVQVTGVTDPVRSGVGSLRIVNSAPASSIVASEAVALQVGHLYRLSGWIRTEAAVSDPTSRFPTAVPACLRMASFPFTNHSTAVGADSPWTEVEALFLATESEDRVQLHLGHNGTATGTAWFDDIRLEKLDDISAFIPPQTVRRFGPAYRFDDRGWIFVHIEGEPYQRGYQLGVLVAEEIVAYATKLGVLENREAPEAGWRSLRFMTDATLLRKYDPELLEEMKGIADGAAHTGAEVDGRPVDLLDIVTLNSVVDLGQMRDAMGVTPHSLTGESFLAAEDELLVAAGEHKCSAFAATGPATADGRVVFGQIFMWWGYTGVHWNVICDLDPTRGHRLVYQTFPGGIHSGADFYINEAGIVIGETTVAQTPYEPEGTPQSDRIRRAAQYASSIDDVVEILWQGNNGMYTNDWPIADVKTDEVAIYLLGTHQRHLWRTSEGLAPFGTPGFLWANNNNRSPEVSKEYIAQPDDAPYDLMFSPWNRDVAFNRFFQEWNGRIDANAAVDLWASSPINRAHACDGKITTSEMAERMVFLAHAGKVTLRGKFPGPDKRYMPDLPGAEPHLSLGYSVVSPLFVTEKLAAAAPATAPGEEADEPALDLGSVEGRYAVDPRRLWHGTVFPASDADGWFVSASAGYWDILHGLPEDEEEAVDVLHGELAGLTARYLYTVAREEDLAAVAARRAYDRYGPYLVPRVKGTFALHQLRLLLGNDGFLRVMTAAHERFRERQMTTADFIAVAEEVSGRDLDRFVRQWLERAGLPALRGSASVEARRRGGWEVRLQVEQAGQPYHLLTSVEVVAGGTRFVRPVTLESPSTSVVLPFDERPERVVLNPFNDVPVANHRFYTWRNLIDDFHHTLIVYGTSRQIEANHTLALRWQETVADRYIEIMPPVVKDCELSEQDLASHDLMVLGGPADNSLVARLAGRLPVEAGRGWFRWHGRTHADSDDGLFLVLPNPWNPAKVLYLALANSAMQLYHMTRQYTWGIPSWALFEGEEVVDQGYHLPEQLVLLDSAEP